jgi:hypothetical protein
MSFDDLLEQAASEHELEQKRAWRKNPKFLAIVGVSKEDIYNGSNYIEKLEYPPWDKRNDTKGAQPATSAKVGFGKHANLTYKELKEQQPGYWNWAIKEIKGFKEKAEKYVNFN